MGDASFVATLSTFTNNRAAQGRGGALQFFAPAIFDGCYFNGNNAGWDGEDIGCISWEGCTLTSSSSCPAGTEDNGCSATVSVWGAGAINSCLCGLLPTIAPSAAPSTVPTHTPSPAPSPAPSPLPSITCASDESIYRLLLYDSGGDGWQGAAFSIYSSSSATGSLDGSVLASGTLPDGFESSEWICLADGCYEFFTSSGSADTEISFEFVDEVRWWQPLQYF